jgi:hypothetical protein
VPRKQVLPVIDHGLTHVLVVGDAETREPIIEHVRKRKLSYWAARCPETAKHSLKHGLRVAMVVIAMANFDDNRTFAAWVNENHPNTTVVFALSENIKEFGPEARATGAKYIVPLAMLARELPLILAYHLEEPAR